MVDAKKLKIQTGVVNRCFKEKNYYLKELAGFEKKLQNTNFKDEEEAYRAKMIPQQIDETKAALKDTENALENAIIALRQLVDDDEVDKSTKEWVAANDKLKEVTA